MDYVQVGISNKMPTVSANRSPREKEFLEDTVNADIKFTRKQLRTEQQRTVTHLNRSLDILEVNGYDHSVTEILEKYDRTVDVCVWEHIPEITRELGEFLKEEKETLIEKLRIIHNADKSFKHAKKNRDLVVRRSQRIRDLKSLRTSIKRNELI